jgi:tellurite resistance protein TehA-like permease
MELQAQQVQQVTDMRTRADRISSFLTVQLIALIGWIIVQSLLFVTPISNSVPFIVKMVIETIWWIATLVIMFYLFRRIYNRFVKAVFDLEDANKRLRQATSDLLQRMANPDEQEQE